LAAPILINRFAFPSPQAVVGKPILVAHDSGQQVGEITQFSRSQGWWFATFTVDPERVPHPVGVGTPVSAGWVPARTADQAGLYECEHNLLCELLEVSLVRAASVAGAEIVSVMRPRQQPPHVVIGVR
jgi:hypothetical protein